MASVPITVLIYNAPLLCGFNVVIKGLKLIKGLKYYFDILSRPAMLQRDVATGGVLSVCLSARPSVTRWH